jgi:hypothetical protein
MIGIHFRVFCLDDGILRVNHPLFLNNLSHISMLFSIMTKVSLLSEKELFKRE